MMDVAEKENDKKTTALNDWKHARTALKVTNSYGLSSLLELAEDRCMTTYQSYELAAFPKLGPAYNDGMAISFGDWFSLGDLRLEVDHLVSYLHDRLCESPLRIARIEVKERVGTTNSSSSRLHFWL